MNNTRFKAVVFLILFGFSVVLVKDVYVQLVKSDIYKKIYIKDTTHAIQLKGFRGIIFDDEGRELAVDYPSYSFYVDPAYFLLLQGKYKRNDYYRLKLKFFFNDIDRYLNLKKGRIINAIFSHPKKRFLILKKNISIKKYKLLKSSRYFIRAFGFIRTFKRYYPDGEFSSHIVGFCYSNGKGAEGLENYYNRYLSPEEVKERAAYDAYGSIIKNVPKNGYDIKTTINKDVQDYLHVELKKCVKEHDADKGMALVMDPYSGAIIAMDSYPFYDNNRYWEYSYKFIKNRVVSDIFEPGSVFKLVTMSAALDSGLFTGSERIYCEDGRWRIKNKIIHDVHRFRTLSFDNVFIYSSNIGSAKIALKIGKKVFYRYLYKFGLGKKTGIDTISEAKGLIKDILRVGDIDLANMAFGQGIGVTEIQLARMYCVVANGGYLVKPHFLRKITRDKATFFRFKPQRERVLRPRTVRKIKGILRRVVLYGTGKKAALPDYVVAGKTGTAQIAQEGKYTKTYVASFAGFAPFNKPRFVVVVSIFNPKKGGIYGGEVAAPLFAKLMEFVLHYYGVPQDNNLANKE